MSSYSPSDSSSSALYTLALTLVCGAGPHVIRHDNVMIPRNVLVSLCAVVR
jgi:hypothetical protein